MQVNYMIAIRLQLSWTNFPLSKLLSVRNIVMDELLVVFNAVKIFIHDHHMSRQNIRSVPKGLTQPMKLRLGIFKDSDSLCVDEIVAIDYFDNCVLHLIFTYLSWSFVMSFYINQVSLRDSVIQ